MQVNTGGRKKVPKTKIAVKDQALYRIVRFYCKFLKCSDKVWGVPSCSKTVVVNILYLAEALVLD